MQIAPIPSPPSPSTDCTVATLLVDLKPAAAPDDAGNAVARHVKAAGGQMENHTDRRWQAIFDRVGDALEAGLAIEKDLPTRATVCVHVGPAVSTGDAGPEQSVEQTRRLLAEGLRLPGRRVVLSGAAQATLMDERSGQPYPLRFFPAKRIRLGSRMEWLFQAIDRAPASSVRPRRRAAPFHIPAAAAGCLLLGAGFAVVGLVSARTAEDRLAEAQKDAREQVEAANHREAGAAEGAQKQRTRAEDAETRLAAVTREQCAQKAQMAQQNLIRQGKLRAILGQQVKRLSDAGADEDLDRVYESLQGPIPTDDQDLRGLTTERVLIELRLFRSPERERMIADALAAVEQLQKAATRKKGVVAAADTRNADPAAAIQKCIHALHAVEGAFQPLDRGD
jgi:hypothetical protein